MISAEGVAKTARENRQKEPSIASLTRFLDAGHLRNTFSIVVSQVSPHCGLSPVYHRERPGVQLGILCQLLDLTKHYKRY